MLALLGLSLLQLYGKGLVGPDAQSHSPRLPGHIIATRLLFMLQPRFDSGDRTELCLLWAFLSSCGLVGMQTGGRWPCAAREYSTCYGLTSGLL